MFLSDILNNAATVVLMAPIGISVAQGLDVSIDPFLMAVAVGGSCAFLTPIGHQSNTLVMGPGGYKFTDYWRMGLPLEILIVLIGVPAILTFWPL
jgi:di/tricarboxylate transporter